MAACYVDALSQLSLKTTQPARMTESSLSAPQTTQFQDT